MKAFKSKMNKYMGPKHNKGDVEKMYKLGKELGSGNFAVVRLASRKDNNEKVAIKIIDKELCQGKEEMIETEIDISRRVQHPNIVQVFDIFDTSDKLYLVMEYIEGGELFDRIVDQGSFTEQDASRIIRQMASAIQYLHKNEIVHRDLKPENILFRTKNMDSDIAIADFGLSKLVNENHMLNTACGTPNYVAPEILRQCGYAKEVDLWSLGVITYILLCGYPPFYDDNDAQLFRKIMKGDYEFNASHWSEISDSAKSLIRALLQVDPKKRFTADQTLNHPWVTGKTARNVNISQSFSTNFRAYSEKLQAAQYAKGGH